MSYLSDRRVVVFVGKATSNEAEFDMELDDGSIVGSWLSLMFINDLPLILPLKNIFMYVDYIYEHSLKELEEKTS